MRIISWNINGLRSFLTKKKGLETLLGLSADIICLQETRLSDNAIEQVLPGYYQTIYNANKSGYAGTAVFSLIEPHSVKYGIGVLDDEGRAITAEYNDFYLVNIYSPSTGSGREWERAQWEDALRHHVQLLQQTKPVIICGDFNVAHLDVDVYSPISSAGMPGFTNKERRMFTTLLSAGFVDCYRVLLPEVTAFTWWSYKGNARKKNEGMRLDYFLASSSMMKRLSSCDILTHMEGSDHCPIQLTLSEEAITNDKKTADNNIIVFPHLGQSKSLVHGFTNNEITSVKANDTSDTASKFQVQRPTKASCTIVTGLQFKRFDYTFTDDAGRRITRSFIILEHEDGMLWFTNYHKYVRSPKSSTHNISQHGVSRFDFIIPLLNYTFFQCGIKSLEDLTIESVQQYLTLYATGQIGNTKKTPQKETVERCIKYVFDFIDIALMDKSIHFSFTREDLYRDVVKRNKCGNVYTEKVPVFTVPYIPRIKVPLNRDIPEKAFFMLLDHIVQYHKDLLGIVILGAFAGTRPGEETNVRCENSPLGPGFIFTIINGVVVKIAIDLTMERTLRSDNIIVGSIKKERMQYVPNLFLQPFMTCYKIYEDYMSQRTRESEYMPFTVNRSGKAMTYDTYRKRFDKIVQEMIPIYLNSGDPELVIYGRVLMDCPIKPHIFRHFYTVQLVLSGVSDVGELMSMRGDSSPESALTYLQNKGELEKQYSLVNNHTFDFLKFSAVAQHSWEGKAT